MHGTSIGCGQAWLALGVLLLHLAFPTVLSAAPFDDDIIGIVNADQQTDTRTRAGAPAPGASSEGPAGKAGRSSEESAVSAVSERIGEVAASFPVRYAKSRSFPYQPGTEKGNLGCGNVVSAVLQEAGVNVWSLKVDGVVAALRQLPFPDSWEPVTPPPYQSGDVVVWGPNRNTRHKHIGIVVKAGNSSMAMHNSSAKRRPTLGQIGYRPIEMVLRKGSGTRTAR